MSLVTPEEQKRIADAIHDVETQTNAELVTVIARASDDYRYIPLLWASLVALVSPALLINTPLYYQGPLYVFGVQIAVLVVLAACFSLTAVRTRLIPKGVRQWRASNMAHRQFLEQGLHHTAGETGVLIFVSEAEKYVQILVDRGISARVDNQRWEEIVRDFVADVRAGRVEQGMIRAIERCGEILAETVPKTPDNQNELDDRLVLVGYG